MNLKILASIFVLSACGAPTGADGIDVDDKRLSKGGGDACAERLIDSDIKRLENADAGAAMGWANNVCERLEPCGSYGRLEKWCAPPS